MDYDDYYTDPDDIPYNWTVRPAEIADIGRIIVEHEFQDSMGNEIPSLGDLPVLDTTGDN